MRTHWPATSSKSTNFYALTQHSRGAPTRLLPLGPPARKGWERRSPLPGSHHPRLSGKFVAGPSSSQPLLLFEVKQPLCVNAAYAGDPTGPKGRFRLRLGRDRLWGVPRRFTPTTGSLQRAIPGHSSSQPSYSISSNIPLSKTDVNIILGKIREKFYHFIKLHCKTPKRCLVFVNSCIYIHKMRF